MGRGNGRGGSRLPPEPPQWVQLCGGGRHTFLHTVLSLKPPEGGSGSGSGQPRWPELWATDYDYTIVPESVFVGAARPATPPAYGGFGAAAASDANRIGKDGSGQTLVAGSGERDRAALLRAVLELRASSSSSSGAGGAAGAAAAAAGGGGDDVWAGHAEAPSPAGLCLAFVSEVVLHSGVVCRSGEFGRGGHQTTLLHEPTEWWVQAKPLVKGRLGADAPSASASASSASASASAAATADGPSASRPPPPAAAAAAAASKCQFEEGFVSKPSDCAACGKFIWGVTKSQQKALLCKRGACDVKIHAKCRDSFTVDCGAALPPDEEEAAASNDVADDEPVEPVRAPVAPDSVFPPPPLTRGGRGSDTKGEVHITSGHSAPFHPPQVFYVSSTGTELALGDGAAPDAADGSKLDRTNGRIMVEVWIQRTARGDFSQDTTFRLERFVFSAADGALVTDECETVVQYSTSCSMPDLGPMPVG